MTHSGGKLHTNVGDIGQRYEVSAYDDGEGKRIVLGFSDDPAVAAQMATAFEKSPQWHFARVRDRRADLPNASYFGGEWDE